MGSALLWIVRRTTFRHFCGGETLQECVKTSQHLAAGGNVRCIVDWSTEEQEDESAWDGNAEKKAETLRLSAEALGANAAFMPIKLTALVSPSLLEQVTSSIASGAPEPLACLDGEERARWDAGLERLRGICRAARDSRVALLLDAEQSGRQPAVHLLARELQSEFNRGTAVVFDTLQMYLSAAPARLEEAMEASRSGGYTFAVKLVRGAYIEQEMPLGVVHGSKADTDAAYDAAAERLLSAMTGDGSQVAVMIATHNRASLLKATATMDRLGLARDHHGVHFAQILGMVDNLTNALGLAGYNASKLVVFGRVEEVLPWLLRRLAENRDAFGAQSLELPVLRAELRRRLLGAGRV